jgi:hypothetical protein
MLTHIVMWRLKDEFSPEDKFKKAIELKVALEGLKNDISEIVSIEVGIDGAIGHRCCCQPQQNFDLCLYSTFESPQALEVYQKHPAHVAVASKVKEAVKERACVDFMQ